MRRRKAMKEGGGRKGEREGGREGGTYPFVGGRALQDVVGEGEEHLFGEVGGREGGREEGREEDEDIKGRRRNKNH